MKQHFLIIVLLTFPNSANKLVVFESTAPILEKITDKINKSLVTWAYLINEGDNINNFKNKVSLISITNYNTFH